MTAHDHDQSVRQSVSVRIYDRQRLVFSMELAGPLVLGRRQPGEPAPYRLIPAADVSRLIIAELDETSVSRTHALLELQPDGVVRVSNRSGGSPLTLDVGHVLQPGDSTDVQCPVLMTLGDKAVRLELAEAERDELQALAEPTIPPGQTMPAFSLASQMRPDRDDVPDPECMLRWLQSTMGVFQSAASSRDFFPDAANSVAAIVDLDFAAVLLLSEGRWRLEVVHAGGSTATVDEWQPSRTILERVRAERRTFRQSPSNRADEPQSLTQVSALVAAPILNREGEVVGALYGDRRRPRSHQVVGPARPEISLLEAKLVELLACGVAAGLARLEQEKAAVAARVQFEQFFTPELARQLEQEPDLLSGKDAEVTLLFCDIHGFSRISERLGPARTVDWVKDVMGRLSECVIAHQGVLVDYIGDELLAMWGAPVACSDHAQLACAAALDMLKILPELNADWSDALGEPVRFGIGINTGTARVGNIGTERKFKYGPLGSAVNLASRVQGATRHLRSRLLVTAATLAQIESGRPCRRLCRVRVVNMIQPVDLYELPLETGPEWCDFKQQYERALDAFEAGDCLTATHLLGSLLARSPEDGPTMQLLSRAVNALAGEAEPFDPVWELPGK